MEFDFNEDFESELEQFFGSREKQLIFGKAWASLYSFTTYKKT